VDQCGHRDQNEQVPDEDGRNDVDHRDGTGAQPDGDALERKRDSRERREPDTDTGERHGSCEETVDG
jgi:hypothetical protein